jgi:hypothetical protein
MPTNDEINACFDYAEPQLHDMAKQFVPFMFQGAAQQALDSKDGKQRAVNLIRGILKTAEIVRAKAVAPKP